MKKNHTNLFEFINMNILSIIIILGMIMPAWPATAAASFMPRQNGTEKNPAWPFEAEAWPRFNDVLSSSMPNDATNIHRRVMKGSPAWPTAQEIAGVAISGTTGITILRTVVLHRSEGQESSISADLVYVDQVKQEMILYDGNLHRISPLTDNTSFDSRVEIAGLLYFFRSRIRPYER